MRFKALLLGWCLVLAQPVWALQGDFAKCRDQFVQVPLAGDDSNDFALCFTGFAVQYSGRLKTPVFAAAVLDRARMEGAKITKRFNEFYEEARLPSRARSLLSDYKRSGFDRGHMYPSGDSDNDETAIQSMSLANMVPQAPELNRGIWNKIERDVRRYAERAEGKVYVLTGPAYLAQPPATIGRGVGVPSHVWKLVHDAAQGRSWAYWIPNRDEAKAPEIIDVNTLSERTGLRFPGYDAKPGETTQPPKD